ncbi:uncharacterized protein METZ01_LOCUS325105 [marine metagenome]|uniref:Uncharacterized protein n=1 Tax=marine metagenome TaxID=408172 RepID=A0A382PK01_9ZZZZ
MRAVIFCKAVAVVEMVAGWVVEIDSPLDQPQPQDTDVEVDVALRISRDPCDVVDAVG